MAKHHPAARRVHRATHDEDKFVAGVLESSAWAQTHGRTLVIAGVLGVLLVVGGLWYRSNRVATRERAASELSQVRATVQSGNVQLAQQDLENYVRRFGSTPSGAEAKLMLAQLHLETNQPAKAIGVLEDLADDSDSPLGYGASLLLGAAHENNKQPAEAERVYLRVADDSRFAFQKREALDRAARLRLEQGNTAGAVQLYERILATFEDEKEEEVNQQEKSVFEMRLAELKAAAPAGKS